MLARRVLLGALALGLATCITPPVWAEDVDLFDNLFLDVSGGVKEPAGQSNTAFGSIGFNWGIPLTPRAEGTALGFQVGGDVSLREGDAEWDAVLGPFARNFQVGNEQMAAALLVDYQRTALHSDLWDIRPVIGITLGAKDAVGLTGVIGLNDQSYTIVTNIVTEEAIDRVEAFWNRAWTEDLHTEFGVGYEFSQVDEVLFRGEAVWGLNRNLDLAVGGAVDTDGSYMVGIRMSFHFGGLGRHDTLHNIYSWGQREHFTPFPKLLGIGTGGLGSGSSVTGSIGGGGGGV